MLRTCTVPDVGTTQADHQFIRLSISGYRFASREVSRLPIVRVAHGSVSDAAGYAAPATEAKNLAVILFLRLLEEGPLMMTPKPEESRKIANEMTELMGKQNIPKEIEKPGKNGPSLDSRIPDRT